MTVVFLIVTALHVKYATIFLPGLFLAQGQRLSKKNPAESLCLEVAT